MPAPATAYAAVLLLSVSLATEISDEATSTGEAEDALDYSINAFGPTHVFQGYGVRVGASVRKKTGSGEIIALSLDGLPAGGQCTLDFWSGKRVYHQGTGVIHIVTSRDTPTGQHILRIKAVSEKTKVERAATYTITVDPVPKPLPKKDVRSNPPIPLVDRWEKQMVTYGAKHAEGDVIQKRGTWEGNVWYYDGQRAYYQIADYTGDPRWLEAAEKVEQVYRDKYVLRNNGATTGYRIFPHGLLEDYKRTDDELSKKAALLLSTRAAYTTRGGGVSTRLSRETAYCLNAYMVAEDLGAPRHPKFDGALDYALGHMDQWFVSKNFLEHDPEGSMPPFMVGLTSEALIRYYEETGDPRIPHVIRTAMDWLWEKAWIENDGSFYYRNRQPYQPAGEPLKGAADLNLLIAPAFAWLYHLTGDPTYRERGDRVFAGGVKGAWLDGGKQFTQSYRWSFDYVQWRRNIPVPDDKEAPVIANLHAEPAGDGAMVVKWTANEPVSAHVEYGETPSYGKITPRTPYLVTSYSHIIAGLNPKRSHHFRVRITDASGNETLSDDIARDPS
jgi:hypothetical protein